MHVHPDHADYVSNILQYWDSATPMQREAGRQWYPKARALAELIAADTGIDTHRVAMAISALSPRNPWRWNVMDAWSFATARASGMTMPRATTFNRNSDAAWRALDPNSNVVWYTAAPKVRAFVACILGDEAATVIDTWAVRIATAGAKYTVRKDADYVAFAHAYNVAANLRDVPPSVMQATTWLVAQQEGLASGRRGRHDLAFKVGTPGWLITALLA